MGHMKSLRYVMGWFTTTALVTFAAWGVVGAAQEQVGEVSSAPLVAVSAPSVVQLKMEDGGLIPVDDSSGTKTTATPTTVADGGVSTTSTSTGSDAPGFVTSTPTTSTTSTTTQAVATSGSTAIPTAGGTVTVSYQNGNVYLIGATPALGFSAEVHEQGPAEVRVEFSSETLGFDVRARWKDGALSISVSQEFESD